MLVYALNLPAPGAEDVVTREVTEVVNGGEPRVFDGTEGDELSYNKADEVSLTLVDVDDDDNRGDTSQPFTFTAADTLRPPQAGQPGVTLVREEP